MNTYETLVAAKELINDPENWMQGDYTNGKGCYCALGAIAVSAGLTQFRSSGHPASLLLREVVESQVKTSETQYETFAAYNDNHTHSEVMEAFDKAIALAKERGI